MWSRRQMEWHADVSALPAYKYLRRMIAISAGLRGCVAVPFEVRGERRVGSVAVGGGGRGGGRGLKVVGRGVADRGGVLRVFLLLG